MMKTMEMIGINSEERCKKLVMNFSREWRCCIGLDVGIPVLKLRELHCIADE